MENLWHKYANANVEASIIEFIGAFSSNLEFEDLVTEKFTAINSMDDLMYYTQFFKHEIIATSTRVIQQCMIDNNTTTNLVTGGDTFQNGLLNMEEALAMDRDCRSEIQRVQEKEMSIRKYRIEIIEGLYEIHKNRIIDSHVSQLGLTST